MTYEFHHSSYPHLYNSPESYIYPTVLIPEVNETSNNKMVKWWSFQNIKEKLKTLFKHHSTDKAHNSLNIDGTQHRWQGKIL